MTESHIRNVIEAALLAAGKPLHAADLVDLFDEGAERPTLAGVQAALAALAEEYSTRGIEIKETAAGFRIQVRADFSNEISRLWPERPAKYSRALLETLAIIAYRQPITRAEIEAVRGVPVNPNIVKTVVERNWVHVVGHRDVPGRPELLATTRDFLDYFGLKRLDELPPLAEVKALGEIKVQFDLPDPGPLALASDSAGATASNTEATAGEGANAVVSNTEAAASGASDSVANADAAAGEATDASASGVEAVARRAGDASAPNTEAAAGAGTDAGASSTEAAVGQASDAANGAAVDDGAAAAANADSAAATAAAAQTHGGNAHADTADGAIAAISNVDATGGDATARATGEEAAHAGAPVEASASDAAAHAEHAAGETGDAGEHTTGGTDATANAPAADVEGSKKRSPSTGRGSGRKKKRGKSQTSDSALQEAEEFAASVDADLAAGDDDGSDEDELSAAGPDSSELVAGPRDIDD